MESPQTKDTKIDVADDISPTSTPASNIVDNKNTHQPSSSPEENSSNGDTISEASDVAIANIVEGQTDQEQFLEDINAAPMHLHALSHIPDARLKGLPRHNSDGKLCQVSDIHHGGRRSRSTSRSRRGPAGSSLRSCNSSRSSSPLPINNNSGRCSEAQQAAITATVVSGGGGEAGSKAGSSTQRRATIGDAASIQTGGGYSTTGQSAHSGVSSLDGIFDPDVLLDRLGFIDLDPPLPHEIRCGPLAAPGTIDGKSNNSGGLTPVNERLSEEILQDCHAFNDLVMIDNLKSGMSSTMSMPSVAHSSLSGMRSDMSVGSLSVGSFKGGHSRGGSVAGGSLMGDGENSVLLGIVDEEGEDAIDEESVPSVAEVKEPVTVAGNGE